MIMSIAYNLIGGLYRLTKSIINTTKYTSKVLAKRAETGNKYPRPDESVKFLNDKLRKQKEEEKIIREKIIRDQIDVAASKEKQAALVFRYLEEKKRMDNQMAKVYRLFKIITNLEKRRKEIYRETRFIIDKSIL